MMIFLEIVLTVAIEVAGTILLELLVELGVRGTVDALKIKKQPNEFVAAIAYAFLAAALGALSLRIFPNHPIKSEYLRLANLFITPALVGWLMATRGKTLRQNEKETIRLDSFIYGFVFAFIFILIRYNHAVKAACFFDPCN
jgi:hypothetical protein